MVEGRKGVRGREERKENMKRQERERWRKREKEKKKEKDKASQWRFYPFWVPRRNIDMGPFFPGITIAWLTIRGAPTVGSFNGALGNCLNCLLVKPALPPASC